jgi:capsid protein
MPGLFQRLKYAVTGRLPAEASVEPRAPAQNAEAEALRQELRDARRQMHVMRAKVDAAQTTDENKRHWAGADALGPNSSLDPATRFRLRNRGRYEGLNNSYCHGLIRSLSYDLIGTGPRLRITSFGPNYAGDSTEAARIIEQNYMKWARAVKWGRKLRIMEKCSVRDGEGFGLLDTNQRLPNAVKLDIRLVEAEQCQSPYPLQNDPYVVDGIRFDQFWEPIEYFFLEFHPGEFNTAGLAVPMHFITVPARQVLHWFECDRPGQMRGIPKITASLPLFSQLRRFTLATLTAAEFAAMLAGVMKTNLPAANGAAASIDRWELVELVRGALVTLPEQWDAQQFEPRQPTANYGDFKRELLNEAGRGPGAPLNVVTGNSSGYNFSSGRLDHLPYQRGHPH